MVNRFVVTSAMIALVLATMAAAPDEKTSDDQFMAVGLARTRAELSVRKLRAFFDESDPNWRAASASAEASHAQVLEVLRKAAEDETKKPEDLRDPNVIDTLAQRRAAIEQDWQRFGNVDRPNLETAYRSAQNSVQSLMQIFQTLVQMDSTWKDAKMDLQPLQEDYDAIGKRAADARRAAEKALSDLQQAQKTWQKTVETATRPSTAADAK